MIVVKFVLFYVAVPFLIHSVAYVFSLYDYNKSKAQGVITLTSLLWPLALVIGILCGIAIGYLELLKWSKAKLIAWKKARAEFKKKQSEVVSEASEVIARTSGRR